MSLFCKRKHFDRWPLSQRQTKLEKNEIKIKNIDKPFFFWENSRLFIAQPRANPHLDTPTPLNVSGRWEGDRKMLPRRQLPPNCTSTCQFLYHPLPIQISRWMDMDRKQKKTEVENQPPDRNAYEKWHSRR